jgi:hypothetical protein
MKLKSMDEVYLHYDGRYYYTLHRINGNYDDIKYSYFDTRDECLQSAYSKFLSVAESIDKDYLFADDSSSLI